MGLTRTKKKGRTHKEEGKGRIQSDAEEKGKILLALKNCIHPLEIESHISDKLMTIYIAEEATDNVNTNKIIEIKNQL